MVITSEKYQTTSTPKSIFEDQMVLTIKSVEKHDLGSYRCIAKNSLGEVESNIRLYGEWTENARSTVGGQQAVLIGVSAENRRGQNKGRGPVSLVGLPCGT